MSKIRDIIRELKEELKSKKQQREGILDQVALVDAELDKYDELIKNIDKDVVERTNKINDAITPVKKAYDKRIEEGCRSNLVWKLVDEYSKSGKAYAWAGDQDFYVYEVVVNEDLNEQINYHGAKYYQKPSNRDYGAHVIADFQGLAFAGSTTLGIHTSTFEAVAADSFFYPPGLQINDKIIDDIEQPRLFSKNDVPEIVGFGFTAFVGVVTSLVGGISSGSNVFRHFGAGDSTMVSIADSIGLSQPYTTGQTTTADLFPNRFSNIVGIGTSTQIIEFFDDQGNLDTAELDIVTYILEDPAAYDVPEATFTVGIVTTIGAAFLSTAANDTSGITTFFAIRTDADLDENFDARDNPHSPEKIGVVGDGNLGVGHSVYYIKNGDPAGPEKWRPETAHEEIKIKKGDSIPAKEEPPIGAGNAPYNVGNFQWPTKTITSSTGSTGRGQSSVSDTEYAELGTRVTIGGTETSTSVGYAATSPQNPSSGSCNNIDDEISDAENNMNQVISENEDEARDILALSETLRTKRSQKELLAWSLLQASASLKNDIKTLEKQLDKLKRGDYRKYNK
tara:strand:- start:1795 stop:3489 length:1695 start_codon:yes stop_codon:yes gene_type:complete